MLSKERKEELIRKGYSEAQINHVDRALQGRTYDDLRRVDFAGNQNFLKILDEFEAYEVAKKENEFENFIAKPREEVDRAKPTQALTDRANDRLWDWWGAKAAAGEKYSMPVAGADGKLVGKRNDCSLSVSSALLDSFNGSILPLETRNSIKALYGGTSETITQGLVDLNGGATAIIRNSEADRKNRNAPLPPELANLSAGSVIGVDMRENGHRFDKGRSNGIDHIVMVVKGKNGETMIAETKGRPESTTIIRPIEEWWRKDGCRAIKMFAVDGDDLRGNLERGATLSKDYNQRAISSIMDQLKEDMKEAAQKAGIDPRLVAIYNDSFENKEGLSPLEYYKRHAKGISENPMEEFQKLSDIKANVIKEKYSPNNEYGLASQLDKESPFQSLSQLITKIVAQLFNFKPEENEKKLELASNENKLKPNQREYKMGDGSVMTITDNLIPSAMYDPIPSEAEKKPKEFAHEMSGPKEIGRG